MISQRNRISAHTSTASSFRQQHVPAMQRVAETVDGRAAEAVPAKMQERNVGHVGFVAKRREELSYSGAIMARYVCINLF